MRLRDMNCVRFLHRTNAKEDFSLNHLVNEKFSFVLPCRRLRQADPRPVRRQTLLRRVARATPLGDSTVTTQDDSCAVTLACGGSAHSRYTAPAIETR